MGLRSGVDRRLKLPLKAPASIEASQSSTNSAITVWFFASE